MAGDDATTTKIGYSVDDLTVPIATITPSPVGIALGSGQALPDLNGPATSSGGCDTCYIVADVAAYIWYSEVFINTAATG